MDDESPPMGFMYSLAHTLSLQIAILGQSKLSPMAAGDTSQTIVYTPLQIMQAFVLCCFTQIECVQF